jgi:tRNA(Ile)-lysidine synthase
VASRPRPKQGTGLQKKPRASGQCLARVSGSSKQLQCHLRDKLLLAGCPGKTLLLALSGGLDSSVLLQLLAALRPHFNFNLHAMHVHHGLNPHADDWAEFCARACASLDVPLQVVHVAVDKHSGLGTEATARAARYQALLSTKADYVLLAHHQDDQAETLLLQLLRGAGMKGLAAMGALDMNKRLLRPLLDVSRAELQAYAERQGLQWVNDESNTDIAFDRNYCRHRIMPVMLERFPSARATLARSALHMAEAAQLLDELAALDAQQHVVDDQLRVSGLAGMSESRARNLLRWWLSASQQPMPGSARLQEALRQLMSAKTDARVRVVLGHVVLRRYRDFAYLETDTETATLAMVWQGEPELTLPDGSRLMFERTTGAGLALERLGISKLRIGRRIGGERFKPDATRPTRTLKHLLQEAQMPPWLREQLPLIYCDDTLAIVPGIGVACELQAGPQETGLLVSWHKS